MAYKAYVTTLKNVRPHPNADRMKLADCFGNTVCVGIDAVEDDVVIYFPTDGQLSAEYAEQNNLIRKLDENGNNIGGYLDPDKRNIKAIKLRGEKSDGLTMPLSSLAYTGANLDEINVGDTIDIVNGHEIYKKYIPRSFGRRSGYKSDVAKKSKEKTIKYPYFDEHIDTPQLRFCMNNFKPGDIICLTEKVHGTSSRNANTYILKNRKNIFDKIFHRKGKMISTTDYVVGTRRTIVENTEGGYYGTNEFRIRWGEQFKGKLHIGEEVFGEIAGYTDDMTPIMGVANNKKTNDKEFIKKFGDTTTFTYGCNENNKSRYFVYRMTYTSPDGYTIEYPWDLVKLRAEQMGFETVPELDRFIYTTEEEFIERIIKWIDIPSIIDSSHIIEGVVIRALNAPNFHVAKEKSWNFKVIEGIVKTEAEMPDMEEAEEILGQE